MPLMVFTVITPDDAYNNCARACWWKGIKCPGGNSLAIATMGRGTLTISSTRSGDADFVLFAVYFVFIAQEG
jgi:hypothetical protein